LRRYTQAGKESVGARFKGQLQELVSKLDRQGFHSSTFQLRLSHFCHWQTDITQRVPQTSV
jgi:hypothetical protein